MSEDSSERVGLDEVTFAFEGEQLERDGVVLEVESVKTADTDPRDDDSRYYLDVRAMSEKAEQEDQHDEMLE